MAADVSNVPGIVKAVSEITACLSLGSLGYLAFRQFRQGRLLEYLPRQRVPWDFKIALLAMSLPLLGLVAMLFDSPETAAAGAGEMTTDALLIAGWGNFTFSMMFVACVAAVLVSFWHANASDLGLPTSWRQLATDVGIGFIAAVAVLFPVYLVQALFISLLNLEVDHPLVEQVKAHNTPAMMALSIALAGIAAPLMEEFTFRGLFQGWLERCEDEAVGNDDTLRQPHVLNANETAVGETQSPESALEAELGSELSNLTATHSYQSEIFEPGGDNEFTNPRSCFSPLPRGWLPILISGTVFGLAHLGHGVAPIPLVLFGIVLGYLYQRTHRLAPCIAAHMFFNGYSLLLLWLQLDVPPAN